jgi:dynein heavy chain
MVYYDTKELGWKPYMDAWIHKKGQDEDFSDFMLELVESLLIPILQVKKTLNDLVPCLETQLIMSFCNLLDALSMNPRNNISWDDKKDDNWYNAFEMWFVFAAIWSLGATVDEKGRKQLDIAVRDLKPIFSPEGTIYDYYISVEKNDLVNFKSKLQPNWKPKPKQVYHQFLVPTVDSVRNKYIIETLLDNKTPVLCVGATGTGKTSVIEQILEANFNDDKRMSFVINFSTFTTSEQVQLIIENHLVRRTKTKMVPSGSKQGLIFIDDLNMPKNDLFGSQPPIQLLKQQMEYGGWFDRSTVERPFRQIMDVQLIAAMGPPVGGRAELNGRFQSKFTMLNFTFPSD